MALPCCADRFDAVVELHAVIHVPRQQHREVDREFARVLRPGGGAGRSPPPGGSNPDWLGTGVEMRWSFPGRERSVDSLESVGFEAVASTRVAGEGGFDLLRLALR